MTLCTLLLRTTNRNRIFAHKATRRHNFSFKERLSFRHVYLHTVMCDCPRLRQSVIEDTERRGIVLHSELEAANEDVVACLVLHGFSQLRAQLFRFFIELLFLFNRRCDFCVNGLDFRLIGIDRKGECFEGSNRRLLGGCLFGFHDDYLILVADFWCARHKRFP